jgi:hypothetical protein
MLDFTPICRNRRDKPVPAGRGAARERGGEEEGMWGLVRGGGKNTGRRMKAVGVFVRERRSGDGRGRFQEGGFRQCPGFCRIRYIIFIS